MEFQQAFVLILLLVAILAFGFLLYRYALLKAQVPLMVQEECDIWRRRAEFELNDKVIARFQEWRDREAQSIIANAEKDSLVRAHNLFKTWCESELETLRREQRELAHREATNHLIEWKNEQEKFIRQDAILRSQAVTVGKMTEHLVPYLPNFNFNPKDVRFIGSPVDFVVFDGLSDDEEDQVRNVVFVEIKTGMSTLTRRERQVRDAIKGGRVRWVEWYANKELRELTPGVFE